MSSNPRVDRLVLQEALSDTGADPVQAKDRRAYYRHQVDQIRAYQADGALDAAFGAEMLFLSLIATIMLPAMLPQIVRLATEPDPNETPFTDRWNAHMDTLATALASMRDPMGVRTAGARVELPLNKGCVSQSPDQTPASSSRFTESVVLFLIRGRSGAASAPPRRMVRDISGSQRVLRGTHATVGTISPLRKEDPVPWLNIRVEIPEIRRAFTVPIDSDAAPDAVVDSFLAKLNERGVSLPGSRYTLRQKDGFSIYEGSVFELVPAAPPSPTGQPEEVPY